jgi:phage-related protein
MVGYQMTADTASELMSAFNRLNALMGGTQVQIIFADEPDKYYIGTCKGIGSPEPGRLAVKGEMEIYCPDPCKYSTVMSEVTAAGAADALEIEYGGTYPARPVISASMTVAGTEVTYELGSAAVQVRKSSFASGDDVEIDCNTATVRLNGTLTPSIGDIANDYEGMLLKPGTNLINITRTGCSPVSTVYYREAWL